jgi:hypothetical protein
MTAQLLEALDYYGERKSLATLPLQPFFESLPVPFEFFPMSTACMRCYQCLWEITDGKLFLKDIHGDLLDGTPLTVKLLFPDSDGPVLADWYSGTLLFPEGKLLKYVHNEFMSKYEHELHIEVDKGIVKSEQMIHNVPPTSL